MTLAPGTRLGPYEIVGQIGAGGMGEVWKARDRRTTYRRASIYETHEQDMAPSLHQYIPFIPFILVNCLSKSFMNRDEGDEGDDKKLFVNTALQQPPFLEAVR